VINRLLLIIDLQHEFIDQNHPLIEACEKAATHYQQVVVTRCINPIGSAFRELLGWTGCDSESEGTVLHRQFATMPHIDKPAYAVDPKLIRPFLTNIDGVDIAGIDTDACVLATAFRLFDANIDVRVRADLCAGKYHDEAILILRRQIGANRVIFR
jgi:nicotinamidase-related amidase